MPWHVESPLASPINPQKVKKRTQQYKIMRLKMTSGDYPALPSGITHNLNSSCPFGLLGWYCFCFNKTKMPV